ncbi:hypothetical protein [Actinobaculum suis]|uniref:hypothetical protein n=1 Tax=Actinobaculum suis TaxID=1657 RepID=UPI00066FF28F|nr:hypothetical protein [Actinobaculum suis]KMY23777.1 hypothetical protein ACU19_01845 [Actinobaculum suis]OCA93264.1 hypothetical protein ACU20_01735 [Actinobaculum suis]OCA94418.1 hypothetical protein ACU21_06810 [Actinobaculum suis]
MDHNPHGAGNRPNSGASTPPDANTPLSGDALAALANLGDLAGLSDLESLDELADLAGLDAVSTSASSADDAETTPTAEDPLAVAALETLAEEGVPEQHCQLDLEFDSPWVDNLTRWAVAVRVEEAAKKQIPDAKIREARTVRDLLAAVQDV